MRIVIFIFIAVVVLVFFSVPGVAAQTPTPAVVHGETGDFVVVPEVTYGQGGIIVALVFLAGIGLVNIVLEVARWTRQ